MKYKEKLTQFAQDRLFEATTQLLGLALRQGDKDKIDKVFERILFWNTTIDRTRLHR